MSDTKKDSLINGFPVATNGTNGFPTVTRFDGSKSIVKGNGRSGVSRRCLYAAVVILFLAVVALTIALILVKIDQDDNTDGKEHGKKNANTQGGMTSPETTKTSTTIPPEVEIDSCDLEQFPSLNRTTTNCSGSGVIQYSIKNVLHPPGLCQTLTLCVMGNNDTAFIEYMQQACDDHKTQFNSFTAKYYPNLGYFITALNGVAAKGNEYWELIEGSTGTQLNLGASSYIPQPGDHIAWNLTVWNPIAPSDHGKMDTTTQAEITSPETTTAPAQAEMTSPETTTAPAQAEITSPEATTAPAEMTTPEVEVVSCDLEEFPSLNRTTTNCSGSGVIQYSIKNVLHPPGLCQTLTLCVMGNNDTAFIEYMQQACDDHKTQFNSFTAKYYPNLGYFITALNGVAAKGSEYWELIEGATGTQLNLGASSYIPQPGDHIAWNLTVWNPHTT